MKNFNKNFIFLCDHAFVGESGKLSLIGIFDKIFLREFPGVHLKLVLVGNYDFLNKDIKEVALEVDLLDETGKSLNLTIPAQKIPLPKSENNNLRKLGFTLEFGNLKFERPGKYTFVIKANSEKIGEHQFEVVKYEQKTIHN